MNLRVTRICALLAAALCCGTSIAQNDLNDLGPVAPGLGINNSGQVVLQNYLYSSGTLTAFPAAFTGTAINSGGVVAGSVAGPLTNQQAPFSCPYVGLDAGATCAFATYNNGTLTTYPIYNAALDPSVGNQAQGINDSGQIVGDWTQRQGLGGALLLSNGTFNAPVFPSSGCGGGLSTPAGVAYAINNAGQVAGLLPVGPGGNCPGDAFLLSQGVYTDIGPGAALALNAAGQVVGYLYFGSPPSGGGLGSPLHAFLYDGASGTAADLGTLPGDYNSFAYAINSSAFIVGSSESSAGAHRAFFYNGGVMSDLNAFVAANDPLKAFVTLTDARGINDSGLIIVNGTDSRDAAHSHAYLLQVPLIQMTPGTLTFPTTQVGSTSAPQTVTFTNAGASALALGTAAVTDSYAIQSNSCGTMLASGAPCMISVVYAPTASGSSAGTLTLPVSGVPIAVALSGNASAPAMQPDAPSSRGGGGGLELISLLSLLGILAAGERWRTGGRAARSQA